MGYENGYFYAYILWCEGTEIWKIGHAHLSVKGRCEKLQDGCPYNLFIWKEFYTLFAVEVERWFHKQLDSSRLRGEWFKISKEYLEGLCSEIPMRGTDLGWRETTNILSGRPQGAKDNARETQ